MCSGSGQIWITADYEIKPFLISLPIGTVHFRDEFYGHAWVGYEGNEGGMAVCVLGLWIGGGMVLRVLAVSFYWQG